MTDATQAGPGLLRIALLVVLVKLLLAVAVVGTLAVLPPMFNHAGYIAIYRGNYGHSPTEPPTVATMLTAWDAQHYLTIARSGYTEAGPDRAFYPLWPHLIRAFAPLTGGDVLLASLLLSNLLSLVGSLLVYDWLARRFDHRVAGWALALLLAFPAAFFLCLPYSESLYVALSAAAFWMMQRGRLGWAAALSALLPLTRPVGIFMMFPLVVTAHRRSGSLRAGLWALPVLAGYGLYFVVLWRETGDPLAGFEIQKQFIAAPSAARLLSPIAFLQSLFDVGKLHGFTDSALDRLSFALFVAACVVLARRWREHLDLLLYALPMGLVPAITSRFMSFTRYTEVIFPAFAAAAILVCSSGRRARAAAVIAMVVMAALQLWLALRFLNYRWAG
ncbi:MAG: mannosyltransferase family protein [Myxococcales bacterium]